MADVAGHGVRVRLGLVSHRPTGRAFATAAPIAALLAGTYAAASVVRDVRTAVSPETHGSSTSGFPDGGPLLAAVSFLVPAALTACAVVADRWSAARVLALLAAASAALFCLLSYTGPLGLDRAAAAELGLGPRGLGLITLNTLILLLSPPDRERRPGTGLWLAVVVTASAVGAAGGGEKWIEVLTTSGLGLWAPLATGAALARSTHGPRDAVMAATVLAAPPLLTPCSSAARRPPPPPCCPSSSSCPPSATWRPEARSSCTAAFRGGGFPAADPRTLPAP
ncbi:hypothetical protein ABWJ92_16920 [Streptomyces sp. NPDC000609]|uniref:hypothetical protein n=1 Tax=Streptomyces sp. NPDC000609 TaxID=3160957 RepID=UPI003392C605